MDRKELNQSRDAIVVKSNTLIRNSRFTLSNQQIKIMNYIISQIDKEDNDLKEYEFSVKTFAALANIDYTYEVSSIEYLKESLKRLSDKSLWLPINENETALVRWIENPIYNAKTDTFRIKINPYLKPYLIALKANFTKIQLRTTLSLRSKYAQIIYELMLSYKYKGEITLTLDKLRDITNTTDKYPRYSNWKQKVLETAISELINSEIYISYKEIKQRNKVVAIHFKITDNDLPFTGNYFGMKKTKKRKNKYE